jgi:hypothetical protein
MLGRPFSTWPVYRRDHDESVLTVTVKSYQPLEVSEEVRSADHVPPAATARVAE